MVLLQSEAPALLHGLLQHEDDIAALSSSGWQTVTSARRPGVDAKDALQHWVRGDPVSDWHFKQQLLQAQQQEAERQRMQEEGLLDDNGNLWFGAEFTWGTFQIAGDYHKCCMPILLLLLTGAGHALCSFETVDQDSFQPAWCITSLLQPGTFLGYNRYPDLLHVVVRSWAKLSLCGT